MPWSLGWLEDVMESKVAGPTPQSQLVGELQPGFTVKQVRACSASSARSQLPCKHQAELQLKTQEQNTLNRRRLSSFCKETYNKLIWDLRTRKVSPPGDPEPSHFFRQTPRNLPC